MQDLEFLVINKFAFIVNCAAEVPNLFEEHGLRYLKFKIKHDKSQQIFDEELKRLKKLKKVVEEAEESGLCCLVHCNTDGYRSLTLVIAFLMERYKWRLRKTIEYLQSKAVPIFLTDRNIEELTTL
jgi:protein-tyrosine phosphatase